MSIISAALVSLMLLACEKPAVQQEPDDKPGNETEQPVGPEEPQEPEEEKDPVEELDLNGYAVFFQDRTSWGATHIYGWSSDGSVTSGWPGNAVTGTVDINEVTYKYVDMGSSLNGKTMKLIFNCNSSQNTSDGYEVTMDRHYYFKITDDSAEEVDPYLSEEAGEEFSLSVASAQFESLPTGGKSITLAAKNHDWTVDLGGCDWVAILDENGNKIPYGEYFAKKVSIDTDIDVRFMRLGHLVRGGHPSLRDRLTASRMGVKAVELIIEGKSNIVVIEDDGKYVPMDIVFALTTDRMYKNKLKDGDLDKYNEVEIGVMQRICRKRTAEIKRLYDVANSIAM